MDGKTEETQFLRNVLVFNTMPLAEMDESWIAEFPHCDVIEKIKNCDRNLSLISRYILEVSGLHNNYWLDFSSQRIRMALIDSSDLQEICFYVGIIIRGSRLRSIVNGKILKEIKNNIGVDAYNYACKTGPLISLSVDRIYTDIPLSSREDFVLAGAVHSLSPIILSEEAYSKRIFFRFPKILTEKIKEYMKRKSYNDRSDKLEPVTRRVIKEIAPGWLPLFN